MTRLAGRMVHSPVQRTGIGQRPTGRQLGHGRRSQPEGRFAEQLTGKVKFSFAKCIGIHVSEIKFVSRAGWRDRSPKQSRQPEPKQLLPRDQDWDPWAHPRFSTRPPRPRLFRQVFFVGIGEAWNKPLFRSPKASRGNESEQKIESGIIFFTLLDQPLSQLELPTRCGSLNKASD